MNNKTYIKKLLRDLRRLEADYDNMVSCREWDGCDEVVDEISSTMEALEMFLNLGATQCKRPKCYGLGDFIAELRTHYKPRPKECEEGYRPHHCDIFYNIEGKEHKCEVRGWRMFRDTIIISACNWTLCAGACTITISRDNVKFVRIEGV